MEEINLLEADVVLHNCILITMDPLIPEATALAIKDTRIIWVGEDKEVASFIGKNTQVIDLKGGYVYPGFIDTHMHVLLTGIVKSYLQLNECREKKQILRKVKEKIVDCSAGEWVIGVGWDEQYWPKDEAVDLIDLDEISPDNPVVLVRCDTHSIWVNSYALKLAGIDGNTLDPKGGQIGRDANGALSGLLIDRAMTLVKNQIPILSLQENKQIIRSVLESCLQKGITTVHNAATDESDFEAFRNLATENALEVRIYLMKAIRNENDSIPLKPQDFGKYLRLGCLKLWMDGALGSRGAFLVEPYSDDLNNYGLLLWDDEPLYSILTQAKIKGFQVAIHAIGDQANHKVLDAYEKIGAKELRWRIEHAQQLLPSDIERFAELKVIAAMQPMHLISDIHWIEKRLGKERLDAGSFALRSLLESGAIVVGGSDAPVVDFNPLFGIYAAITRQDLNQFPHEGMSPHQKLTPYEALKMYTIDAAYACFNENEIGSITKGKLADLVVLQENLLTCQPKAMLDMQVLYTFVNGKIRYSHPKQGMAKSFT